MRKTGTCCIPCFLLITMLVFFAGCKAGTPHTALPQAPVMAAGMLKLMESYPGHFTLSYPNHLIWNDGTAMPFNIQETASACAEDLEAQLALPYIMGKDYPVPVPKNYDPGRTRYEPFFKKMYGQTAAEVRQKLAPVRWLPQTVKRTLWVSSINGIDKMLQAVSDELDQLPDNIKRFAVHSDGTFNWRTIQDSDSLSPHSFGIAIDLDSGLSGYWRWDYPGTREEQDIDIRYRNTIPLEIVEIFEKYGFIWGGKWYHYDTMHFEYRPELTGLKVYP